MSYIDPKIKGHFETLPIELKDLILEKDVSLYTLKDLINCLEKIVAENE